MEKCDFCNYKNIEHVIAYDMMLDKCSECGYIKIPMILFETFIKSYLYNVNFANLKKAMDMSDIEKTDFDMIKMFISYLDITNFSLIGKSDKKCNFCGSSLAIFQNIYFKNFKIYYCDYCNSIYFLKSSFEEAGSYFQSYVKKRFKWYGFLYRIKEIFQ